MPQPHQLKFRASASFLNRIKSECIKREMSLQELFTTSVKFYIQTPPSEWKSGTLYINEDEKGIERHDWLSLWHKFLTEMPRQKVLLMVDVMKLDLRHYKSSRRKADLRKHKVPPKGSGKQKGR